MNATPARQARREAMEWVGLYAYEHPTADAWRGALAAIEHQLSLPPTPMSEHDALTAARRRRRLRDAATFMRTAVRQRDTRDTWYLNTAI